MPVVIISVVVAILLVATVVSRRRERRWAERASNAELEGVSSPRPDADHLWGRGFGSPGGGLNRR